MRSRIQLFCFINFLPRAIIYMRKILNFQVNIFEYVKRCFIGNKLICNLKLWL